MTDISLDSTLKTPRFDFFEIAEMGFPPPSSRIQWIQPFCFEANDLERRYSIFWQLPTIGGVDNPMLEDEREARPCA